MKKLAKKYDAKEIESRLSEKFLEQNLAKTKLDKSKIPYSIALPPPNVTGSLHMGHAFQQTIMDVLIRYNKICGKNIHWQLGLDHAGIATQMLVENNLIKSENKNRHDLGRDKFLEKVWTWQDKSKENIKAQMMRLGLLANWDDAKFTLDEDMQDSVKEAFIRLYDDNLIYKGKKLVNWDSKLKTAISDLEVENQQIQGKLYYLKYSLKKNKANLEFLEIATTRPETLLGDVAIAINPDDKRYQNLKGAKAILPILDKEIDIIFDEHVDKDFGSGCVKITPAHDFNDYEIAKRHELDLINILDQNAKIKEVADIYKTDGILKTDKRTLPKDFANQEVKKARELIIKKLKNLGLFLEEKDHIINLPKGDRSSVVIEPLLTDQWYVKTKDLAKKAKQAITTNKIKFVPKNYENMFFAWIDNINDWCISRQLWWGHRIPVFYDSQNNIYVGKTEEDIRIKYKLKKDVKLTQDQDVLDTWFSSALWTFATLGWPKNSEKLEHFHPTSVLVTGFDIIFFWVARMIMFSLYFLKDQKENIPFKEIYITGLIRDENGQKMSKSKGNVIDPIDLIDGIDQKDLIEKRTKNLMQENVREKIIKNTKKNYPNGIKAYGTDALRFTILALASNGRDINFSLNRLEGYRNFCNKIFNATNFFLQNLADDFVADETFRSIDLVDTFIFSKLNEFTLNYHQYIKEYRFDLLAQELYNFVWHKFCDWYLEMIKPDFKISKRRQENAIYILEHILVLINPIMPFLTEELFNKIPRKYSFKIQSMTWLQADVMHIDKEVLTQIDFMQEVIIKIRNIRAKNNIKPKEKLSLFAKTDDLDPCIKKQIINLAGLKDIKTLKKELKISATILVENKEFKLDLSDFIDLDLEKKRLEKELENLQKNEQVLANKLKNKNFIENAPIDLVNKTKLNHEDILQKIKVCQGKIIEF